MSAETPVKNLYAQNRDTLSLANPMTDLIRLIKGSKTTEMHDSILTDSLDIALGALEFVSSVYEDNDYYASGYWGEVEGNIVSPRVYTEPLPRYATTQFQMPVTGIITSPFGLRSDGGKMHKGIDISLKTGDSVRVALDGKVERTGFERGGYGYFVIVSHPEGLQTRYAHLQRPSVVAGAEVRAGDPIGVGGSSGNSTGPHLHFEIRCQGRIVDPTFLISRSNGLHR